MWHPELCPGLAQPLPAAEHTPDTLPRQSLSTACCDLSTSLLLLSEAVVPLLPKAMYKLQVSQGPGSLQGTESEDSPVKALLLFRVGGGEAGDGVGCPGGLSVLSQAFCLPLSLLPLSFSPLPSLMSPTISLCLCLFPLSLWLCALLSAPAMFSIPGSLTLYWVKGSPPPKKNRTVRNSSTLETLEVCPFRGLHSMGPAQSSQ